MITAEALLSEKHVDNHSTVKLFVNNNSKIAHISDFICSHTRFSAENEFKWVNSKDHLDTPKLNGSAGLVNMQRINDIHHINSYFENINKRMDMGQYLVVPLETNDDRRERILNKFSPLIAKSYYLLDFILKRVLPKWKPTRQIYFKITKGRNRVISLAEGLARLVCCGFEIKEFKKIGHNTWIIAKKSHEPAFDNRPTWGAMIRLARVGESGKMFKVFKFRTMYPYSEYLQEYMFEKCNLEEGGKFSNDFRLTSYGRFFRKYWIDELPMFINFFKGEVKLVGVRPLSEQYFGLYPTDLQKLRIKVKPGLVPPYYADMPKGLEEIQESERRYLNSYLEKPFRTDVRYFFKIFYNIIFKGVRSK